MQAQYPIVVRPWRSGRFWLKLLASAGAAAGFAALAVVALRNPDIDARLDGLAAGVFALFGALAAVGVIRQRISFFETWIEVRSGANYKELSRADLLGYRRRGDDLDLVPRDAVKRTISIPAYLLTDERTAPWFEGVPDLDRHGAITPQALIDRDRLDRLRRLATLLQYAAVGLMLWGLLNPYPYLLVIGVLIAMPFAAGLINLGSGGMLRFGGSDERDKREDADVVEVEDDPDPRPSLQSWISLPAGVLLLRLMLDCQLLDWWTLVAWAAGLGALMTIYGALRDRSLRSAGALFAAFLACGVYCGGAIGLIDVFGDFSPAQRFPVKIYSMHEPSGSSPRLYDVDVSAWGPKPDGGEVSVTSAFFHRHQKGDHVCMYMGRGLFAIAWYELGDC